MWPHGHTHAPCFEARHFDALETVQEAAEAGFGSLRLVWGARERRSEAGSCQEERWFCV